MTPVSVIEVFEGELPYMVFKTKKKKDGQASDIHVRSIGYCNPLTSIMNVCPKVTT